MEQDRRDRPELTRREFVGATLVAGVAANTLDAQTPAGAGMVSCSLTINRQRHDLQLDPRVTVLDLLRERLHYTGTKKGCGHGQCGACTVLINGRRMNSCLALAVSHDGDQITTIEGLASGETLHPMQQAFLNFDGFQCGYCTPGQICSAVAMMEEARAGIPSAVTANIGRVEPVSLSDDEIRERMAGNICRCGAYPNIVAAVKYVAHEQRRSG